MVIAILLFVAANKSKIIAEKLSLAANIAGIVSLLAAVLVFVVPASTPSDSTSPPTLVIEGPLTAPLGETTYYTIISQNADRGIWSVGGFHNEPIVVEPLGPSHQIFVEPTDATRVGDSFTIVFTAYNASGQSTIARKQFEVVSR